MKWDGSSLKGLSPNLWDLNVPSGNLQVDSIIITSWISGPPPSIREFLGGGVEKLHPHTLELGEESLVGHWEFAEVPK